MATRINVRELRDSLGLSREQFRKAIGASNRTVRRWENGEAEPSQMALKRLAEVQEEQPSSGPRRREVVLA